jgi:hypothetical protein
MSVARTVRNETKAISLKLSDLRNGEYLLYKLKVWGAKGIFSVVDEKGRILMKNNDYPDQEQDYVRKWPKTPADIPAENDIIYTLAVSFNAATKYSYVVELVNENESLSKTIKNIDFESDNAGDSDYNTLRVLFT